MQQQVEALIAQRPAAIVLDVAGLMPIDEMGVLMLPAMATDAAEEGVTVVLANPSRPLRDRLAQLGVRNLTFVYRPAPTAPTEDGWAGPMNGIPWAWHAPPRATSTASEVWRRDIVSPAALTFSRSLLRRRVMSSPLPPDMDESYVEVLLLTYEELTSNAIRHGRLPVYVMLTTMDDGWLIDVVDAATECTPRPPVDRDPAQGGLGLHLVARLCTRHGWWTEHDRKHVWALIQPGDRWGSAHASGAVEV